MNKLMVLMVVALMSLSTVACDRIQEVGEWIDDPTAKIEEVKAQVVEKYADEIEAGKAKLGELEEKADAVLEVGTTKVDAVQEVATTPVETLNE